MAADAPEGPGAMLRQYGELLSEQGVFDEALQTYLRGSPSRLASVLELMETVFEVLGEVGLRNHNNVYLGVKRQPQNVFAGSGVWQTCHVSGIVSRDCVQVDDAVFVHKKYLKWLQCLWLATHIREQEQVRALKTHAADVPPAHAGMYRAAVQFVLEQLEQLYGSVGAEVWKHKKTNVFAGP
jgi:hypothetical protein